MNSPPQPAVLPGSHAAESCIAEGCAITELSNSEADPGLSVAQARVPPGVTTRWHRLRDTAERYVILAGSALVELGGQSPTPVTEHDVVIIPPGCPQRITNTGSSDLLFLALCTPRFRADAYEDLDPDEPLSAP